MSECVCACVFLSCPLKLQSVHDPNDTHTLTAWQAVCPRVKAVSLNVCVTESEHGVAYILSKLCCMCRWGVASCGHLCLGLTVLFCLWAYVCAQFGMWMHDDSKSGRDSWHCIIISKSSQWLSHTNTQQMVFLATEWCKDDSDDSCEYDGERDYFSVQ